MRLRLSGRRIRRRMRDRRRRAKREGRGRARSSRGLIYVHTVHSRAECRASEWGLVKFASRRNLQFTSPSVPLSPPSVPLVHGQSPCTTPRRNISRWQTEFDGPEGLSSTPREHFRIRPSSRPLSHPAFCSLSDPGFPLVSNRLKRLRTNRDTRCTRWGPRPHVDLDPFTSNLCSETSETLLRPVTICSLISSPPLVSVHSFTLAPPTLFPGSD